MAVVDARGPRTYGNWRRPTSAGLLGLGSLGTSLLIGGLVVVVLVVMLAGLLRGLITAAILAFVLGLILVRDRHGRNLLSRAFTRVTWLSSKSRGAHLYRSGPLGRALWGSHQLPGLAAGSTLSEHADSYGRSFAMIHVPASNSYTVVIGTEPDGASLVDRDQVDLWVADWGHWLSQLADEPGVEAGSVTIEAAPDSGSRLRREVAANADPAAPAFARAVLAEVVSRYPAGSSTLRAFVAITFAASVNGKKRGHREMGRDLAARLPGLTHGLQATGAGAARPLTAAELCEAVRIAYDPAAATVIDDAHTAGERTELDWSEVGPAAAETSWDSYRHDSGHSVTWSMTLAPRGTVQSSVLAKLLAPHRDVDRKRVTIVYRPIDPGRAAGIVESDLRSAEFRKTTTRQPTARDVLSARSAAATAAEEAAGAGLVNFGLLVTATVLDPSRLSEARAAVDNLSATARLRLRPVYGAQDSAFAAALPLGLVMQKHLKMPADLKDRL